MTTQADAAGAVWVNDVNRGCGFLVAPQLAVTANHVVRRKDGSTESPSETRLEIAGRRFGVARIDGDLKLDVATLHLVEEATDWLRTGRGEAGQHWTVRTQPAANDPVLDGTITAIHRGYENRRGEGAVGHQLQVAQDLDDYGGYSGSPVEGPPGVVIGVLVEQVRSRLAHALGEPVRAAPVLYATPIEEVVERFSLQQRVTPAPRCGIDVRRSVERFEELLRAKLGGTPGHEGEYLKVLVRRRPGASTGDPAAGAEGEVPVEAPPAQFVAAPGARLLMVGEGGGGKTTALLKLGLDTAREAVARPDAPVPLYLPLNLAGSTQGVSTGGLLDLLAEQNGVTAATLREACMGGHQELLFLLDGVNEVRDALADDLIVALLRLIATGRHRYLLSSRPTRVAEQLALRGEGLQVLEVVQLTEDQVDAYLVQQGLETLSRRMGRELKGLARNPFMLWAVVQACHGVDGPVLPANAGELYRLFLDDYVFGRREPSKANPGVSFDYPAVKRPVLAWLAATMTGAGGTRLLLDGALLDQLIEKLEQCAGSGATRRRRALAPIDWTVDDFLDEIVYNGVLHRAGETVTFMHESVQSYFTALDVATWPVERVLAAVPSLVWRWVEIGQTAWDTSSGMMTAAVVMLGGLDRSAELVTALLDHNPMVAARCLAGSSVGPAVRTRVIDTWVRLLSRGDARTSLVACTCLRLAHADDAVVVDALLAAGSDVSHPAEVAFAVVDALLVGSSEAATDALVRLGLSGHRPRAYARYLLTRRTTADQLAGLIRAWRTAEAEEARHSLQELMARVDVELFDQLIRQLWTSAEQRRDRDGSAALDLVATSVEGWRRSIPDDSRIFTAWEATDAMRRAEKERKGLLLELLTAEPSAVRVALTRGRPLDRLAASAAAATLLPDADDALLRAVWQEDDDSMAHRIAEGLAGCVMSDETLDALLGDLKGHGPLATIQLPGSANPSADPRALRRALVEADLLRPAGNEVKQLVVTAEAGGWRVRREYPELGLLLTSVPSGFAVFDGDRRCRSALALALVDPPLAREVLARHLARIVDDAEQDLTAFAAWEAHAFTGRLVELLGELQAEDAAPTLLDLMRREIAEPDSGLVQPLIDALSRLRFPQAVSVIFEAMTRPRSDDGFETTWNSTSDIEDGRVVDTMRALSRYGEQEEIRSWLHVALADPDPRRRRAAARGLGTLKISAELLASTALNDADAGVRRTAAEALRWYEDGEWLDQVEEGLAAPEADVRVAAAEALATLVEPRAIPRFVDALRDADERVRLTAAEALWDLNAHGDPAPAVEPLLAIARDGEAPDRAARAGVRLVEMEACTWEELPSTALEAIVRSDRLGADERQQAFDALGGWDWPPVAAAASFSEEADPAALVETVSGLIATPEGRVAPAFEVWALWVRACAYGKLGELDRALDDAVTSGLPAYDPLGASHLADRLWEAGRHARAREFLADALEARLELRPYTEDIDASVRDEGEFRLALGWIAYLDGDGSTAISEATTAARIAAGEIGAMAMFNLGLAQLVLGDPGTAVATYEDALARCDELDRDDAARLVAVALADLDKGEPRAPRDAFRTVRALLAAGR